MWDVTFSLFGYILQSMILTRSSSSSSRFFSGLSLSLLSYHSYFSTSMLIDCLREAISDIKDSICSLIFMLFLVFGFVKVGENSSKLVSFTCFLGISSFSNDWFLEPCILLLIYPLKFDRGGEGDIRLLYLVFLPLLARMLFLIFFAFFLTFKSASISEFTAADLFPTYKLVLPIALVVRSCVGPVLLM